MLVGTGADESRSSLDALDGSINGESTVMVNYVGIFYNWSDHAGV